MGLSIKAAKTVTEAKTKAPAKTSSKTSAKVKQVTETQMMVDELVSLTKTLEELEVDAMQKRVSELKSRLQSIANESNHDQEVKFSGTIGAVTFSKCREETNIVDRDAMIKKLTPEVFVQVGKVTLTDIKKYLSEGEIMSFSEKVYGSRTLKHTEKFEA